MTQVDGVNDTITAMTVGERAGFDTRRHLKNAERQARERGFDDMLIVDVDAHHFENRSYGRIFEYIEDPVLRHLTLSSRNVGAGGSPVFHSGGRNQFNAGRLLRFTQDEDFSADVHPDVVFSRRQREAIGIDYQIVFPTAMLRLGLHPDPRVETALAWAYTRWWVEEVMPQDTRIKTMIYLPFHDPGACMRMIERFGDEPGVLGFMVTSTRYSAVHHDEYMPIYAALEERDLPLGFHAAFNQHERIFEGMDKFLSVHALGFVLNNLVHATNLVVNGIPERFPRMRWIMIESGLAWIPFLMQRLDNEYQMRSNEAPLLKRLPSEYMAENFYYTTQPIETDNLEALELTMKMINADSNLMFASDYPHWDFNLPSTVYDLPFLSETSKRNILGRNALEAFPRLRADIEADGLSDLLT